MLQILRFGLECRARLELGLALLLVAGRLGL